MTSIAGELKRALELFTRYEESGDQVALAEAIPLFDEPIQDLRRRGDLHWYDLAGLRARGRLMLGRDRESASDLGAAIHEFESLLEQAGTSEAQRAEWHSNCSLALRKRFALGGVMCAGSDLDQAIEHSQQAVAFTPSASDKRGIALSTLAGHLRARWEYFDDLAALDRASEVLDRALAETPPESSMARVLECNLAGALADQDLATRDDVRLARAIEVAAAAFNKTHARAPFRGRICSIYAAALLRRYGRQGGIADLDSAMTALRAVLAEHHEPDLAVAAVNLGAALLIRYRALRQKRDLREALQLVGAIADPRLPTPEPGPETRALLAAILLETAVAEERPDLLPVAWINNVAAELKGQHGVPYVPSSSSNRQLLATTEQELLRVDAADDRKSMAEARAAVLGLGVSKLSRLARELRGERSNLEPSRRNVAALARYLDATTEADAVAVMREQGLDQIAQWPNLLLAAAARLGSARSYEASRVLLRRVRDVWRRTAAAYVRGRLSIVWMGLIKNGSRSPQEYSLVVNHLCSLLNASHWSEEIAIFASAPEITEWADLLDSIALQSNAPAAIATLIRALATRLRAVAAQGPVEAIVSLEGASTSDVEASWREEGGDARSLESEHRFLGWLQADDGERVRIENNGSLYMHIDRHAEVERMRKLGASRSEISKDLDDIDNLEELQRQAHEQCVAAARAGHRRAKSAVAASIADPSKKIGLYLRTFRRETSQGVFGSGHRFQGEVFAAHGYDRGDEEALANTCAPHASLVAIANPLDERPSDAIPKLHAPPGEWRHVVSHLVRRASFIVVGLTGNGEGVQYELTLIEALAKTRCTLIVVRDEEQQFLPEHNRPKYHWSAPRIAKLSRFGTVISGRDVTFDDILSVMITTG